MSNAFLNPSLEHSSPGFSPRRANNVTTKRVRWRIVVLSVSWDGKGTTAFWLVIAVSVGGVPLHIQNAFMIITRYSFQMPGEAGRQYCLRVTWRRGKQIDGYASTWPTAVLGYQGWEVPSRALVLPVCSSQRFTPTNHLDLQVPTPKTYEM